MRPRLQRGREEDQDPEKRGAHSYMTMLGNDKEKRPYREEARRSDLIIHQNGAVLSMRLLLHACPQIFPKFIAMTLVLTRLTSYITAT